MQFLQIVQLVFFVTLSIFCGGLFEFVVAVTSFSTAFIRQDFVLIDNSNQNVMADPRSQFVDYTQMIQSLQGAAQLPQEGLGGLLYDRGEGCVGPVFGYAQLPKNLPKIALLEYELLNSSSLSLPPSINNSTLTTNTSSGGVLGADCSVEQALKLAELDGAVGVILYFNNTNGSAPVKTSSMRLIANTRLAVFAVDASTLLSLRATILYQQLNSTSPPPPPSNNSSNSSSNATIKAADILGGLGKPFESLNARTRYIRVTMYPEQSTFPGVWEFTLIIIVVLLTLSFITSVAMHCHLYRMRRSNGGIDNFEPDAMRGTTTSQTLVLPRLLGKATLEGFPVIVYSDHDLMLSGQVKKSFSQVNILSHETIPPKTAASLTSPVSAAVVAGSLTPGLGINEKGPASTSSATTAAAAPTAVKDAEKSPHITLPIQLEISVCAICIDDFELGDHVRILPCGHRYHMDCIDPWLMEKSAACPLCKTDFYKEDGSGSSLQSLTPSIVPTAVAGEEGEFIQGSPQHVGGRFGRTLRAMVRGLTPAVEEQRGGWFLPIFERRNPRPQTR